MNSFECFICFGDLEEKSEICKKCEACYHKECLKIWHKVCELNLMDNTCPKCRSVLSKNNKEKWKNSLLDIGNWYFIEHKIYPNSKRLGILKDVAFMRNNIIYTFDILTSQSEIRFMNKKTSFENNLWNFYTKENIHINNE